MLRHALIVLCVLAAIPLVSANHLDDCWAQHVEDDSASYSFCFEDAERPTQGPDGNLIYVEYTIDQAFQASILMMENFIEQAMDEGARYQDITITLAHSSVDDGQIGIQDGCTGNSGPARSCQEAKLLNMDLDQFIADKQGIDIRFASDPDLTARRAIVTITYDVPEQPETTYTRPIETPTDTGTVVIPQPEEGNCWEYIDSSHGADNVFVWCYDEGTQEPLALWDWLEGFAVGARDRIMVIFQPSEAGEEEKEKIEEVLRSRVGQTGVEIDSVPSQITKGRAAIVVQKDADTTPTEDDQKPLSKTIAHPTTTRAGNNEHYLKLHYTRYEHVPHLPYNYPRELSTWLRRTKDQTGGGYLAVVEYASEAEERIHAHERGLRIREDILDWQLRAHRHNQIDTVLPVRYVIKERVITHPTTDLDDVDQDIYAYVFTKETASMADKVFTERVGWSPVQTAEDVNWDADKNWQDLMETIEDDVTEKALKINETLGIRVYPVTSPEPFFIEDEEILASQVAAALLGRPVWVEHDSRGRRHVAGEDGDDELVERLSAGLPAPCANYLLITPESVDLWAGKECKLSYSKSAVSRAPPTQKAVELLKSASHTDRADPYDLLLAAHRLVQRNERTRGKELAEYVTRFPHWNTVPGVNESAAVIINHAALPGTGDLDGLKAILDETTATYDRVHPRFQQRAAQVAVEAARMIMYHEEHQVEGCEPLATTIERYRGDLRRATILRDALQQLQECQENRIRTTCEVLEGDHIYSDTRIVYVDDGARNFDRWVHDLNARLETIPPFGETIKGTDIWDHFTFKTVKAPSRIAQPRDTAMSVPRADTQLIRRISRSCPGELYIVISDEPFYPAIYGGTGLISTEGCADDLRCMNTHLLRTMGLTLFDFDVEDNTVTAPLARDTSELTLRERLSFTQYNTIIEYVEERT